MSEFKSYSRYIEEIQNLHANLERAEHIVGDQEPHSEDASNEVFNRLWELQNNLTGGRFTRSHSHFMLDECMTMFRENCRDEDGTLNVRRGHAAAQEYIALTRKALNN